MDLPKEYIDDTYGVRPGPNQGSFNNIVYLAWYAIGKQQAGTLTNEDLDAVAAHVELNKDEDGLYSPKNSHDNLTYKIVLDKVFHLGVTKDMNFFSAVKQMGIYRIWDVITYGAVFGPLVLRPLFRMLLWIPALQMIQACWTEGKVRPKFFADGRYKWWFKPKRLYDVETTHGKTIKTWMFSDESKKKTYHMQNDGKHLAIFRLFALKKSFTTFNVCAKICKAILVRKYGQDYAYEVVERYFSDQNHPVPPIWKNNGDIL